MNATETTYTTDLHEWLPSQPQLHGPCIHIKVLGRGKELRFDCWTACFRCVVKAS